MKRRDLNPSVSQLAARLAAARAEATAGATAPSGNKALTDSADITWGQTSSTDAGDGETHGTWTQTGSVRDTAQRVSTLESTTARLAEGIATAGRWNTVSTSQPPESTDGYPDGAWWVMVTSATDTTATACWQAVDGQWTSQPLPASQVVAPTLNAGLIDVALLAAKIITSDEFWTALDGERVGFNADGFQAYDADGAETVHVDGQTNYMSGMLRAGGALFASWLSGAARRSGVIWDGGQQHGMTDEDITQYPRVIVSQSADQTLSDLLLTSGITGNLQAILQLSQQLGKASLEARDDQGMRSMLNLRTDTASSLAGSDGQGRTSSIQFGNGYLDLIGQVGTGLAGTMVRTGIVTIGSMQTGTINRTTVTPGGSPPSWWTGKWLPIVIPFDWRDGARLVPKITAADAASFTVATECTSGSTKEAGFLWLAVRRASW
ncbi:hypothetical protein [Propionibacterium australiense]|uniref:Uncharacterized protein n=1 Tax=Propionibacterium australiense TaxID=119981 RepID=A0A8B3FIP6_9ACTN|nr:hypothetical protein [Propionibacterium australiense]RLP08923.1 hypothetical protein D7U36_08935 [Propionibacterium australiense]